MDLFIENTSLEIQVLFCVFFPLLLLPFPNGLMSGAVGFVLATHTHTHTKRKICRNCRNTAQGWIVSD